jgi:hypothetical protein
MKKIIGLVALAAAAYLLYKNSKKETPSAPRVNQLPLVEPQSSSAAEKMFKASISANKEVLFSGQKQYVTLENLIPNRYGMYNNFYGKDYNQRNVEDTTDILSAEKTQKSFIRPKPLFDNTL